MRYFLVKYLKGQEPAIPTAIMVGVEDGNLDPQQIMDSFDQIMEGLSSPGDEARITDVQKVDW